MCEYTIPLIVPQDLDDVNPAELWKSTDVWTLAKPQILMNANDFLSQSLREHYKYWQGKPSDWLHFFALAVKSNRYKPPKKPRKPIKKKPRKRTKKR